MKASPCKTWYVMFLTVDSGNGLIRCLIISYKFSFMYSKMKYSLLFSLTTSCSRTMLACFSFISDCIGEPDTRTGHKSMQAPRAVLLATWQVYSCNRTHGTLTSLRLTHSSQVLNSFFILSEWRGKEYLVMLAGLAELLTSAWRVLSLLFDCY